MKNLFNIIEKTFLSIVLLAIYPNKTKTKREYMETIDKYNNYINMLNQWIINLHDNKLIYQYLIKNNYKKIAIYDMGEMGTRLYEELKDCKEIEIKYGIDKNDKVISSKIDIFKIEDKLPIVDVIIIANFFDYDNIKKELSLKINTSIISLEDIIYNS